MSVTHRFRNHSAGFTLIEVMIVVAIIAILAAIAIPSYQESVRKSARADARGAILTMMQQQERYFSQNNTYLAVSSAAASSTFKNWAGDSGFGGAKWILSSASCTGDTIENCVAISATPQTGVWTDDVTQISYTSRGQYSCMPSGVAANKCWPR